MKISRILFFGTLLAALPACDRREAQQPDEREIERRVQQRLAEERLSDEQRRAREREEELAKRETALERRERELREQAAATPAPTATPEPERAETAGSYQIFYDALAPYGGWMEVDPYGYIWQPREAVRDWRWRPYTDGRWAHTDYGWTWISNEPFGWATYHYGRWVKLRRLGWCWVPGDQWAPAWVAWRTSERYVGWAPLPPEARFDGASGIHEWADSRFDIAASDYAFVPASDFGEERVEGAVLPPEQNGTIVNETTNVTNIVESNQLIVNNGPDFRVAQARSRRLIAQFRVERSPQVRGGQNATVVKGDTLQFSAPVIRKNSAQARPAQTGPRVVDAKAHGNPAPAQNRPEPAPAQDPQAIAPQVTSVLGTAARPAFSPATQPAGSSDARAATLQEQAEKRRALTESQQAERARFIQENERAARIQEQQRSGTALRPPAQSAVSAAPQRPAPVAPMKREAPVPNNPQPARDAESQRQPAQNSGIERMPALQNPAPSTPQHLDPAALPSPGAILRGR